MPVQPLGEIDIVHAVQRVPPGNSLLYTASLLFVRSPALAFSRSCACDVPYEAVLFSRIRRQWESGFSFIHKTVDISWKW